MMGWWNDSEIQFSLHENWDDVQILLTPLLAEEQLGKKVLDVNPDTIKK